MYVIQHHSTRRHPPHNLNDTYIHFIHIHVHIQSQGIGKKEKGRDQGKKVERKGKECIGTTLHMLTFETNFGYI